MTKTKRYYVVRHTWTVIHEGESWDDDPNEDHLGSFHFAENTCSANTIDDLAKLVNRPENERVCVVCHGHEGKYLGRYDTLEQAKAAHRDGIDLNHRYKDPE